MGKNRAYEIAFVGLKQGIHVFEYDLDEKFFTDRAGHDLNPTEAQVKMTLDKQSGFMQLGFEVGGKSSVNCDRCGNPLVVDLWDEFKILVKLVDEPDVMNAQEEDPDVFYISRNESHLQVDGWLYEFVMLSLPQQNICPDDENGHTTCNAEVLKKLEEINFNFKAQETANIWKGLEKFKDN